MESIKILHLSDVHFGQNDPDNEQPRFTEELIKKIKDISNIDLVLFSGDLTQKAIASEFQLGQNWLEEIHDVTESKMLICPGNHDINRSLAKNEILRLAAQSDEAFNISKKTIYKSHDHLRNFFTWHKQLCDESEDFLPIWANENPFVGECKITIKEINLHIICLNTASLSCSDKDKGYLCVDIASLNASLLKSDAENEIVIVVAHHPIETWLASWNAKKIKQILSQETGAHIYLHGHLHEPSGNVNFSSSGAGICTITSGATYQGSKWVQSFNVVEIFPNNNIIKPSIYIFHNDSGKWLLSSENSREMPLKLPNINYLKNDTKCSEKEEIGNWDNPFDNVIANSMDPHVIPHLFVDRNNFINRVSNIGETIIEGQRGTGKTMLLRYHSLEVQYSQIATHSKNVLEYFRKKNIPIGIYNSLSNAGFNKSDTEAIENKTRREHLFYHQMTLFLISNTICSFSIFNLFKNKTLLSKTSTFRVLKRILKTDEFDLCNDWTNLAIITSEICNMRLEELDQHIASILPGETNIPFNPWLSISTSFFTLLKSLYQDFQLSAPFYILLDDFDTLNIEQQSLIFKVARERKHSLLCFKFGIMTLGQKTNIASDNHTYREGDDYHLVSLNWVDHGLSSRKGEQGNYKLTVAEIAKRRIEESNWPSDIKFETIFNTWSHGNEIRKEVKQLSKAEYESMPVNERPTNFDSFWAKQGDSKFFRYLKSKKIEHKYAGSSTIIALSSGIFRQFLEISSNIVLAALDSDWEPSKKKIGPVIQNQAIREYSRDMFRSLGVTAGDTSSLSQYNYEITSTHLVNFTQCLLNLFSSRLYYGNKDAEVIAISIKDGLRENSYAKALLDIAVRESILHKRSIDYTAKSGGIDRLPTYMLNRRLAPCGNLGLKMQGRYELSKHDIEIAAKTPELFLKKYSIKKRISIVGDKNQGTLDLI